MRGAGKGRREEVLTGGAGLSAEAAGAGRWAGWVAGGVTRSVGARRAGWLAPPGGAGVAATPGDGKRGGGGVREAGPRRGQAVLDGKGRGPSWAGAVWAAGFLLGWASSRVLGSLSISI